MGPGANNIALGMLLILSMAAGALSIFYICWRTLVGLKFFDRLRLFSRNLIGFFGGIFSAILFVYVSIKIIDTKFFGAFASVFISASFFIICLILVRVVWKRGRLG